MKRMFWVVAAVMVGLVATIGPATADYHSLCDSSPPPSDGHTVTNTGTQLRAAANIQCYGRTVTVEMFQVLDVATQQVVASLSAPLVCTNVCTGSQTEIFAPPTAGHYEVSLRFRISGNSFSNARQSEYLFVGSGQPSQTCGFRFGGFPVNCV